MKGEIPGERRSLSKSDASGLILIAKHNDKHNEEELEKADPIFRLDELSEPIGPLTNTEIDRLVYGE